jgi:uncharacterized protein YhaN
MVALGASAILLTGCATAPGSCDSTNKDVSLIAKMNCDHSGGYSDQVRQNEQELMDAREENAAFRQVYDDIVIQQKNTRATLDQQRAQNAALDKSLNNLIGQLKKHRSNQADVQQQVKALENEIAATRNQSGGNEAAKQAELTVLRKKVSQLELSLGY